MTAPSFAKVIRRARFLALALAGCAVAMGISFSTVRYLTRHFDMVPAADAQALQRARILRTFANELTALVSAHQERLPRQGSAATAAFAAWVEQEMRPRLLDLRSRMESLPAPARVTALPQYRTLLAAVNRALALAAHPEDRDLSRSVAQEVSHAVAQVEAYIASLGVNRYLGEPVHRLPEFQ